MKSEVALYFRWRLTLISFKEARILFLSMYLKLVMSQKHFVEFIVEVVHEILMKWISRGEREWGSRRGVSRVRSLKLQNWKGKLLNV